MPVQEVDEASPVTPEGAQSKSRPIGWEGATFCLVLVLQLVPIALLRHLGTQDGPSHLATARVLLDYGDKSHPIYHRFYRLDAFPSPNLLTEGLLALLGTIFRLETAEKILAAGYLVGLPLSVRFALRRLSPRNTWLSFAAFPLANGFLFANGFYNYSYGLIAFVLGCWWVFTAEERSRGKYATGLCLLLLFAYVTHFLPAALLAMIALLRPVMGSISLLRRERQPLVGMREVAREFSPTVLAMVPFLILTLIFLSRPAPQKSRRDSPVGLVVELPTLLKPIVSFSRREAPLVLLLTTALLTLMVVALVQAKQAAFTGRNGLMVIAIVLAVIVYVAAPETTAQGGAVNTRLALLVPLLLLMWLASVLRLRSSLQLLAAVTFVIVALGIAIVRLPVERQHSRDVDAYAQAAASVRPGSTLVGLQFVNGRYRPVRQLGDSTLHGSSYVAALTHGVDVGHYEANFSYFPTQWRHSYNPRLRIDPTLLGLDETPPDVDLLREPQAAGGPPDYVLLRGDVAAVPAAQRPQATKVLSELNQAYRLVRLIPGRAQLRLYQLRTM